MRARTPRRAPRQQTARERRRALDTDGTASQATSAVREPRPRGLRQWLAVSAAVIVLLLTSACGAGSMIPNPFASNEPTPKPAAPTTATSKPTLAPDTAAPAANQPAPAFTPFWVKNHRLTEMWSGPTEGAGSVSFGTTSQQFCSFQVVLPPDGPRVYVLNPYSQNYFWIDADAIGPVGPPEQRTGAPPPGQNCTDAIYTG